MSAKQAGKMIVIFTVAFLVTSSLFVMLGDEGGQGTWPVGPVAGTLEDYSSSSTGLPSDGDYYFLKFGDLNDDGYDDLVAGAGQYQGTKDAAGIWAYTYKPSSDSWEKNSTGLPTTGYFAGLDLGDVDNDDDLDIVVGGEGLPARPSRAAVYTSTTAPQAARSTGTRRRDPRPPGTTIRSSWPT